MILHLKMLMFISMLIWREYFHMTKIIGARNVKTVRIWILGLESTVLDSRCWVLGSGFLSWFWCSIMDPGSWVLGLIFWVLGLVPVSRYYKMWQKYISKCDRYYKVWQLLQSATESLYKLWRVLQNATGITKCDRYYKVWKEVITKCDRYYKVRQFLQSQT